MSDLISEAQTQWEADYTPEQAWKAAENRMHIAAMVIAKTVAEWGAIPDVQTVQRWRDSVADEQIKWNAYRATWESLSVTEEHMTEHVDETDWLEA